MARDILGEFGNDTSQPQVAPAKCGGVETAKPIANYSPPKGPTNIMDGRKPGLHGSVLPAGTQGKR